MKFITKENAHHFLNEINYLEISREMTNGMINFIDYMKLFMLEIVGADIMRQSIELRTSLTKILNNESITFPILYPLDFRYIITKVNRIKVIKSHTSPYILDVEISPIDSPEVKRNVKFILKRDIGLRKEKIISCLIKLLQYKLKEQMILKRISKFEMPPSYFINVITKDIGAIEFVENSYTLREINQKGKTLQNFILENNRHQSIDTVKTKFCNSLSIASITSYMLGLGDRHLDNIMVNKSGQIFHIDYGYIMENPTTNLLGAPNIKVTSDMIDFLGGKESPYYKIFSKFSVKVYDILRLYKSIIIYYYDMMGNEKLIDLTLLRDKLESRFMEGLTFEDIGITLINEIESSNSLISKFNDICHTTSQSTSSFISRIIS